MFSFRVKVMSGFVLAFVSAAFPVNTTTQNTPANLVMPAALMVQPDK